MDTSALRDFTVKRAQLDHTRWAPAQTRSARELADGEVILKVDRYTFTTNNMTYALLGELLRY